MQIVNMCIQLQYLIQMPREYYGSETSTCVVANFCIHLRAKIAKLIGYLATGHKAVTGYSTLEAIFSICTSFHKNPKKSGNFLQKSGYFAILNGKLWQILIFLIILRKLLVINIKKFGGNYPKGKLPSKPKKFTLGPDISFEIFVD